jgi:YD repeat-containing protein
MAIQSVRGIHGERTRGYKRAQKIISLGRTTMIIIAIVLALALAGEAQAQDFAGGSGTASDPFLVADAAHLNSVRHHLTAYFRQTADIDLAAAPWNQDEGWLPIGTPDSPFEGRYDGDGRRISGLTINRPNENDVGLFGATREGAEIISTQVEDVRVTGNERVGGLVGANNGSVSTASAGGRVGGGWRVGGLVGDNAGGTVSGCAAEVTVEPAASWSTWQFGGLVGRNGVEGLVENSHSDGSVTSDGELGGLVGTNEGTVTRCVSNAAVIGNWYFIGGLVGLNEGNISDSQAVGGVNLDVVSAPNGGYIGGLAGWNQGTIFLSYASGPVTATGGANAVIYGAGGLVGENTQQGSIQRCHADSTVSVNLGLAYYVGGLVGDNSGAITESHATGSVTSTSTQSYAIGGLVGDHNGLLEKSHASGPVTVGWETVTGVHGYAVGGLVGDNGSNGTITQCHASGDVVVNAQYDGPTGGLIGTNRGTVSDSYATGDVFGEWRVGGLAGENFGGLTGCFAIGAVHGGSGVGGLVGLSSSNGRVGECYATGAVTGNQSVGGLAGSNLGTISECYALGRVTGHTEVGGLVGWNRSSSTLRGTIAVSYAAGAVVAGGEHVGGLVGRNDGDVEAAYWDLETTGQEESPGGQGRTTAQMIYPHDAETTYWEWDFQETWAEDVRSLRNGGYPYLRQLPPLSRTVIRSPFRSGTLVAGDVLRFSAGALDDAAATYLWDFDDGRTSVLRDPGLVGFPNPGEFQVICSVQMEVIETFRQEIRTFDVVEDTGDIPDLRVTDVRVPTDIATGSPAAITYTVQNLGQGPAGPSWVDKIYLSTDPFLDVDDTLLAEITINRALEQGDTYQNTITVTLPVLEEGLYYLILSANDEWHLLERVRLNNLHAAPVTVRIPSLAPNDLFTSPYTAGFVEQYFRITATGGENLMLNLLDADPGLVAHVRFGALPTRATYDYRWTGGPLLIPLASAGDWYILVFGIIARDGDYQIGFEPSELVLTSHSPSSQGTGTDLQLILNGSGFMHPMVVELVSSHGAVYGALEVNVDALTRATAFFPAGSVLPGIYDVRISRNGRQAQRPQSLEIIAAAQSRPKLEVDLILPSQLSYSRPATLYVEYANTGNVPMAAPLLVVTATQNDQPGALLTLDGDQLQAGVWSSATPQGFANAAQFLASGQTPGLLQPGETGRIPVYYAGWQRPWDMSDPPTLWYVYAIGSDDATAVNWEEMKHRMRPGYVTESAWDVIWQNFRTLAGDTWGDFIWMLSRDALYLYRQDRRVDDIDSLMAFSLRQAEGLAPLAVLAASTDVFVQGPGLPLIFERSYLQSISRRFEMGPLGRGWTHNWQVSLTAQVDGTVAIIDQTGTPRLFHPDRRYTGRYLAQPGDEGDLRQADGGYRLIEINGIVQFFTADGNLDFVEDTNGNRITCTYAGGVLTRLTHSSGGYLEIGYTGGLLTTVTDRHGRQVRYTYDGDYLVSHMTDDQRETVYQYHRNAGSAQHALAAVTLPDGVTRHFGYDALGRLIRIHRNADQELVTLAHAGSGQVDMTNALGHTARFFFDEWGRLVKTENPLDEVIKFSFDAQGRPVAVTGPDGHVDQFRFDRRVDPPGLPIPAT